MNISACRHSNETESNPKLSNRVLRGSSGNNNAATMITHTSHDRRLHYLSTIRSIPLSLFAFVALFIFAARFFPFILLLVPFKVSIIFDNVCSIWLCLIVCGVESRLVAIAVDWVSAKANLKKKKRKKNRIESARARAHLKHRVQATLRTHIAHIPLSSLAISHCINSFVGLLLRIFLFYCKLIDWLDFLACRLHRGRMISDDYWLFSCRGWVFVVVRFVWKIYYVLLFFFNQMMMKPKREGRESREVYRFRIASPGEKERKTVTAKKKNF